MRTSLIALLLIVSTPAWADWQHTKWGMTLEELVTSGNGDITPNTDRAKDFTRGPKALLKQPYRANNIDFTAYYMFEDNKLVAVSLNANSYEKTVGLLLTMKEIYGKPVEEKEVNAGCKMRTATWRHKGTNNTVSFAELACGSQKPIVTITYSPLQDPGRSGL